MVRKPKAAEAEKFPRKTIPCESGPSAEEQGRAYAKLLTAPDVCGYRVIVASSPKGLVEEIDAPTFLATLRDQAAAVQEGNMSHAEAMLITQATARQSLFVRLAERGLSQEHMPNLEAFMRLALRAQSQCRATLETLAAIKNPPIVYARQANVTTGPQQVNNGTVAPSRALETESQQRQILGPSRWAAYQDGLFEFSDLTKTYNDRLYGPMRSERSLQELIGPEIARAYMRKPA